MDKPTLSISNLSIDSMTGRKVVDALSFSIDSNSKLAIIGAEGVGKTTLLNVLAGKQVPGFKFTGQVNTGSVGLFTQQFEPEWLGFSIPHYLLSDSPNDEYLDWNLYNDAHQALEIVGLSTDLLQDEQRMISQLSGGEKVRAQLAKLLLKKPDVIALDEPTNYLDIETIQWLERFIKESRIPVLFVTHDERLIEACANKILYLQHVEGTNQARYIFSGTDYNTFKQNRESEIVKSESEDSKRRVAIKSAKRELAETQSKSDARLKKGKSSAEGVSEKNKAMRAGSKQATIINRIKDELDELVTSNAPLRRDEDINVQFPFAANIPAGKNVVDITIPNLAIEAQILAKDIHLVVTGNERVVITGKNGVGKSTFVKALNEELSKKEGLTVGYIPQQHEDVLHDANKPAIEYLNEIHPNATYNSTLLKRLGFERDDMHNKPTNLSGGQKTKLLIARTVVSGANVLLMDEPTTNLSPLSMSSLIDALNEFPGAVIAVSHDRNFISKIATTVYELTPQGLKDREITDFSQETSYTSRNSKKFDLRP